MNWLRQQTPMTVSAALMAVGNIALVAAFLSIGRYAVAIVPAIGACGGIVSVYCGIKGQHLRRLIAEMEARTP